MLQENDDLSHHSLVFQVNYSAEEYKDVLMECKAAV